ncbi:MAG: DUF364 domain-containing protein [Candidatus Berkelbacteria bacterium]|nr:DUF364 domain-containing protein [Candidatus Berkelbacteria bacterium]
MILDKIYRKGLNDLRNMTNVNLRVDNIIIGQSIYTMKGVDRNFYDMYFCLLLLENAYGFSYFQGKPNLKLIKQFIDKDITKIMDCVEAPLYFKVAAVDALYCLVNKKSTIQYKFLKGDLRNKARQRAKQLVKDIPPKSRVLLVGAVTEIIEEAHSQGLNLSVVDLENTKIDLIIDEAVVNDGKNKIINKIRQSDYVVATGMTFSTDTADKIIRACKENGIKSIFFMQTGANFGNELINLGVDKVLSEYFPFYDFQGDTKYAVFAK